MSNAHLLLPAGAEVSFGEIGAALARDQARDTRPLQARALMATVVAVGETSRLVEAGDVLQRLGESLPVRAILISYGDDPAPAARVGGRVVALQELRPAYVNNAIAALRLSSLPTAVWWRGGPLEMLEGTASLADRVILDVEDPAALWVRAIDLAERTAFSDVRWARLTRWRALMAHFFDIPAVQAVASQFTRLQVAGADDTTMALFSGWLRASLGWGDDMRIELEQTRGTAPIERVVLADGQQQLSLQLAPRGHCVKSAARVANHSASRTVSLGDQRLPAVILEELRVRSRDLAFERAVRASLATL